MKEEAYSRVERRGKKACGLGRQLFAVLTIALGVSILLGGNARLHAYTLNLEFGTDGFHFNNADFIGYNDQRYEENQAVDRQNSDDRQSFIASSIMLSFMQRYKYSEFFATVRQSASWGSDSLEGRPEKNNTITYNELFFNYYFTDKLKMSLGRYRFRLEDSTEEYFFNDTIDGITLRHRLPWGMEYRFLADVLGIASKPEDTRVWFSLAKDEQTIDDFRGDVISARLGLIFDHEAFKIYNEFLKYKIFAFYLRYGANAEGGADIAENGNSSLNQADNDYLFNGGVRLNYKIGKVWQTDLTGAYALGADHQFNNERKYQDLAVAWNHRLDFSSFDLPADLMFDISLGYFGPKYASMKANSPGGVLVMAYKGYFPSPYAYFYHFRDKAKTPSDVGAVDKTVSKTFGKLNFSTYYWGILSQVSAMALFANERDNDGKTQYGETNVYMGTELEWELRYNIDNIEFNFIAAMFLPGDYYGKRSEENTRLPLGEDPMYGFGLSTTYSLDFS